MAERQGRAGSVGPAPRPHLVVLDDDASIRALLRDLFESEGFRATLLAAPIPPRALIALEPDLLILDLLIGTGQAAGPTYLHQLNADPTTAALPVLICSAATDLIERRPDLERGSCAICPKPFDLDDLLAAVRFCLANPETRAASA